MAQIQYVSFYALGGCAAIRSKGLHVHPNGAFRRTTLSTLIYLYQIIDSKALQCLQSPALSRRKRVQSNPMLAT